MPHVTDATTVKIDLKWAIFVVGTLISTAASAGVLVYQVNDLRTQVSILQASQQQSREAIIALTATLQARGVLK